MVRWVVGSILHGVDPLSYFSFKQVLHDWCNKGRGMRYPACGMMHIKEPLLLIGKSSPCGGSRFPPSQSEWSFTICMTPYNPKQNVLSASLNKIIPSFLIFYIKCSGTHTCMYTEYKIWLVFRLNFHWLLQWFTCSACFSVNLCSPTYTFSCWFHHWI